MNNTFSEECIVEHIGSPEWITTRRGMDLQKQVAIFRMVKLNDHENRHPQPAYPEVQFIGGKCKYLTGIEPGDKVTLTFTFVTRTRKDGTKFTNVIADTLYKGYQMGGANEPG